jgi:hypothetical protein
MPEQLVMVTGELHIETTDSAPGHDGPEEGIGEQIHINIDVKKLEPLENYQGRGLVGALVELPPGEYPGKLLAILSQNRGSLPVAFEYKTNKGEIVKIKAGAKHGLNYSPDLEDRLKAETGCILRWLH